MESLYKIVEFENYCKDCVYFDKVEMEDPCNECLQIPSRIDSRKPEYFEKKRGK